MQLSEAIQGCIKNNRKAQEWMYRTYFPVLLPMCKRFATDEDRVITYMNDGFMKVFKNIQKLKDEEKIVPWMKRITYHAICDNLRKEKNKVRLIELGDNDRKQTPDALNQLYEEDIILLVDQLPTASADVFVLYAIHGYTHKEIGKLKNISEGTSKWHYSEARKKLRVLLEQQIKYSAYAL
jgi:RNA polymerase sigma-70 factor (ECF subfamily)